MNKKILRLIVIFTVILFFVYVLAISIYKNSKSPKYIPIVTKEYSSYADWKNECIKINSKNFSLNLYTSNIIFCSGNYNNQDISIDLTGDEIGNFNYQDFPELKKQIIIDKTLEADMNKQNSHPNWKLYKDVKLGFELEFPYNFDYSPFYIDGDNKFFIGGFNFKNTDGASYNISVTVYDNQAYNLIRSLSFPLGVSLTAEELNIGGQIITKYSYYDESPACFNCPNEPRAEVFFVLAKNGKVYEVRGSTSRSELTENKMSEIISTFKVL